MGLVLKPHSVTVFAPSKASVGGKPGTVAWSGVGASRMVQITPMSAEAAFQRAGVEVSRPHLLLDEPEGASSYPINAKVTLGSRTFYVVGPPEVFDGIADAASHCSVLLKEDK